MVLQIRNPAVINQQNMGRYLPILITVLEANGFPVCRSLKVLKELNDPQGEERAFYVAASLTGYRLQYLQLVQ